MCMDSVKMNLAAAKREAEYRAEDDHRTLQRAEEVRADPSRLKGVAMHHRKKMVEMRRVGSQLGVPTLGNPKRKIGKRRVSMARARSGR